MKDILKDPSYVVYATHVERHMLERTYSRSTSWVTLEENIEVGVGYIDNNYPIAISCTVCLLHGNTVVFVTPTGRYVDWDMITEYVDRQFKGIRQTNPFYFRNVVDYCASTAPQPPKLREFIPYLGKDIVLVLQSGCERRGTLYSIVEGGVVVHEAEYSVTAIKYFIPI